jgi:hypothetical protein
MKEYPFWILEDHDIIQKGDEQRDPIPASWRSQSCDDSLDHERMQWKTIYPVWHGRTVAEMKGEDYTQWEFRRPKPSSETKDVQA